MLTARARPLDKINRSQQPLIYEGRARPSSTAPHGVSYRNWINPDRSQTRRGPGFSIRSRSPGCSMRSSFYTPFGVTWFSIAIDLYVKPVVTAARAGIPASRSPAPRMYGDGSRRLVSSVVATVRSQRTTEPGL